MPRYRLLRVLTLLVLTFDLSLGLPEFEAPGTSFFQPIHSETSAASSTHTLQLRIEESDTHEEAQDHLHQTGNSGHGSYDFLGPPTSKAHKCSITHTHDNWLNADCSYRYFHEISELNITTPERIWRLDLTGNYISELPEGHLSRFKNLRSLTFNKNNIRSLNNGSFDGLSNLVTLDFEKNLLSMTKGNFPIASFVPLVKLEALHLNNNPNDEKETNLTLDYPDWALSPLTSLKRLYMDGLPEKPFGRGFQNMSSLEHLGLNGFYGPCYIHHLYNDTFQHLSQLTYLQMQHCRLEYDKIEPGVLQPLTRLLELDVSNNANLNIDGLIPLLSGNNNTLTTLITHGIAERFSRSRCVSNKLAAALPRSIQFIDAESNTLEIVSDRVFELLPPNLTTLHVDSNRFHFGGYLQNMSKLQNLKELHVNGRVDNLNLPSYYSQELQPNRSECTFGKVNTSGSFRFGLPPKLENLQMTYASLNFDITKFHIDSKNSLVFLELKGNNFPTLSGPVIGLNRLKKLDLSYNNIRQITTSFFQYFPHLKTLKMAGNDCGKSFNMKSGFVGLPKTLEYLDLSNTDMEDIHLDPEDTKNLKFVNLSNCKMVSFTLNLTLAKNLTHLDLSFNHIYTLNQDVTEALNDIPYLFIDFSNNTIGCYCGNMPFLNWLSSYPHLIHRDNLQLSCDYQHAVAPIKSFDLTVERMRRECASNLVLLYICTSITSSFTFFIFLTIAYRFRWRLTYWYYSLYLKISSTRGQSHITGKTDFEQDVLISYCEVDQDLAELTMNEELTALGCRVRLKGRDFKPGNSEYLNIIESVQMCRRTLVVLSPEMLSDKWCKATVNLAGMEAQSSERSIVIFLVLRPVTAEELGKDLLFQVQTSPIFYFPPRESWENEREMKTFWTRLCKSLF